MYPLSQKTTKNGKLATVNNLSVYYQNVRGLNTKLDTFIRNIALLNYDLIILTEIWLSRSVNDSELGLCSHYAVFRCYRHEIHGPDIRGGGVLIAVKVQFHVIA